MNRVLPLSLLLAPIALPSLPAQSYLHTPPTIATKEGGSSSAVPFSFENARFQFLDGDHRGSAVSLREVAFRLNYQTYGGSIGYGRSWSGVTVMFAGGDRSRFTTHMARNPLTAPTLVFQGSVTLPSLSGLPATRPAAWGGPGNALHFPFRAPWLHQGTGDILSDWTFRSGVLAGNLPWPAFPPPYPLDSHQNSVAAGHRAAMSLVPRTRLDNNSPGVTARCNDAQITTNTGATTVGTAVVHDPSSPTPQYRGKLVLNTSSAGTAPGAPVIHAWAVGVHAAGLDLGTGCNRWHAASIVALQAFTTPPRWRNPRGIGQAPELVLPWSTGLSNWAISAQAAWADSASGRLALSQAAQFFLPALDFTAPLSVRLAVYDTGIGPQGPFDNEYYNPVMRYRR